MKNTLYLVVLLSLITFTANAANIFTKVGYQNNGWCTQNSNPNCAIPEQSTGKNIQVAIMCFKKDERISGMNKICYYNCLGSEAAITVASYELCPLTIDR